MLQSLTGNIMTTICDHCGDEKITDLTNTVTGKDSLDQWECLYVPCSCGSGQAFNMNIPVDDTDEPFATGDLPIDEEVQRYYLRLLIRMVREDFRSQ
jgi:hypothetical protein